MVYRNNKTGKLYRWLALATDATNSRDGTEVAVYCPCDDGHTIYVRDHVEFHEKFTLAEAQEPQR